MKMPGLAYASELCRCFRKLKGYRQGRLEPVVLAVWHQQKPRLCCNFQMNLQYYYTVELLHKESCCKPNTVLYGDGLEIHALQQEFSGGTERVQVIFHTRSEQRGNSRLSICANEPVLRRQGTHLKNAEPKDCSLLDSNRARLNASGLAL